MSSFKPSAARTYHTYRTYLDLVLLVLLCLTFLCLGPTPPLRAQGLSLGFPPGGSGGLPAATFASPPSSPTLNQAFLFSDASATGVCTGGGTLTYSVCVWNGSSFQAIGGTSTGLGDPGTNGVVYRNGSGTTIDATATQMSGPNFCADAGSTDTYACNLSPAIASYTTGTLYWFKANTLNTGASSVNFNGKGALAIKTINAGITTDTITGDILAGQWVTVVYDGTNAQMVSQRGTAVDTMSTQTITNKTVDGVSPATMAFVDPTSSVQTQINGKQASLTTGSQDSVFNGTLALTAITNCVSTGGVLHYGTATHLFSCYTLASADIPNNAANTSGTAAALATSPTNCNAGNFPLGINASGVAQNCTRLPQLFFGTTAPGSVSGNLPGDIFSDTTGHNAYWCNATSGTAAPACTSVTTGGWTLLNGGGGGSGCVPSSLAGVVQAGNGSGACQNTSITDNGTTVATTEPITTPSIATGASPPTATFGTGGAWVGKEGTAPSVGLPASTVDGCYFDSTQHGILCSWNNGSLLPLPQAPASTTSGHFALWNSSIGSSLSDAGALTGIVRGNATAAEISGDCATSGSNAVICTKTNSVAFTALATTAPGTGVATFLATPSGVNFNSMIAAGGIPISQNSQSTGYTLVLADGGGSVLHPTADNNARTFTIPANASVAYPVGTVLTFINQINTVTIAITSDTLQLAGTATTGSRSLAAGGMATAVKVTSTLWFISGPGLT